jgi:hypothetical protein
MQSESNQKDSSYMQLFSCSYPGVSIKLKDTPVFIYKGGVFIW